MLQKQTLIMYTLWPKFHGWVIWEVIHDWGIDMALYSCQYVMFNAPCWGINFLSLNQYVIKHNIVTSVSVRFSTPTHFEALMLALFNRLRALQFGLLGPFFAVDPSPCANSNPSLCPLGGLWVVRATDSAVRFTKSTLFILQCQIVQHFEIYKQTNEPSPKHEFNSIIPKKNEEKGKLENLEIK